MEREYYRVLLELDRIKPLLYLAEARAEKAEARVKSRNNHIHRLLGEALESERNLDGIKSRLQEAEARAECAESTQPNLCQWLSDIAVELGCDCDNEAMLLAVNGLKARAEKAEAENEWLKAQRRYLANALSSYGDDDEEMSPEDWERSARRAMAAGEGTCQK